MTVADLSGNSPLRAGDRLDAGTVHLLRAVAASVLSKIAYPKNRDYLDFSCSHSGDAETVIEGRGEDGDAWMPLYTFNGSGTVRLPFVRQIRADTTIVSGTASLTMS